MPRTTVLVRLRALAIPALLAAGVVSSGVGSAFASAAESAIQVSDPGLDQAPAQLFSERRRREVLAAQVWLDQARFSPGPVDGVWGANTARAIRAFQQRAGLPVDGKIDGPLLQRLRKAGSGAVVVSYTIQDADVKGPFLNAIPASMEDQAKLERLGYTSPQELLAEKHHTTVGLLKALNPRTDFTRSGGEILVPASGSDELGTEVARIEVDKGENAVRAYDAAGNLVALYPATIGSQSLPSPDGSMKVRVVAPDPAYYFDPRGRSWGPDQRLKIAPGPNNPVGSMWIDLTKDGYGIHGSPLPRMIAKQASHGCVRLTNWDAKELGAAVRAGTDVVFIPA